MEGTDEDGGRDAFSPTQARSLSNDGDLYSSSDKAQDLRQAAEIGQTLLRQKKELQSRLEEIEKEKDAAKTQLDGWLTFAGKMNLNIDATPERAWEVVRVSEERLKALLTECGEKSARVIQLEAANLEMETTSSELRTLLADSQRSEGTLKMRLERMLDQGDVLERLSKSQEELERAKKDARAAWDRVKILENDIAQYQEELAAAQDKAENARAEVVKMKRAVRASSMTPRGRRGGGGETTPREGGEGDEGCQECVNLRVSLARTQLTINELTEKLAVQRLSTPSAARNLHLSAQESLMSSSNDHDSESPAPYMQPPRRRSRSREIVPIEQARAYRNPEDERRKSSAHGDVLGGAEAARVCVFLGCLDVPACVQTASVSGLLGNVGSSAPVRAPSPVALISFDDPPSPSSAPTINADLVSLNMNVGASNPFDSPMGCVLMAPLAALQHNGPSAPGGQQQHASVHSTLAKAPPPPPPRQPHSGTSHTLTGSALVKDVLPAISVPVPAAEQSAAGLRPEPPTSMGETGSCVADSEVDSNASAADMESGTGSPRARTLNAPPQASAQRPAIVPRLSLDSIVSEQERYIPPKASPIAPSDVYAQHHRTTAGQALRPPNAPQAPTPFPPTAAIMPYKQPARLAEAPPPQAPNRPGHSSLSPSSSYTPNAFKLTPPTDQQKTIEGLLDGVPPPLHQEMAAMLGDLFKRSNAQVRPAPVVPGRERDAYAAVTSGTTPRGGPGPPPVSLVLDGHFLLTYTGIVMNNSRLMRRCEGSAESLLNRSRSVPFFEWAAWIRAQLRDHMGKQQDDGLSDEDDRENDTLRLGGPGGMTELEMNAMMGVRKADTFSNSTPRKSFWSPFRSSKHSANPSEGDWSSQHSGMSSLSGASVVEPLQGLCQRLLLNNATLAAKLKTQTQRRKALELALEMEQMDREEETQRADAVKRVVDLLSEQLTAREEEITSLRRQLGFDARDITSNNTSPNFAGKVNRIIARNPSPRRPDGRPAGIVFDTQYDMRR